MKYNDFNFDLLLQILSLPSKLFYNNRLTCRAQFQADGPKRIPPLQFIGVDGRERQDVDSPSFYNDEEATKIVEEVSHSLCSTTTVSTIITEYMFTCTCTVP